MATVNYSIPEELKDAFNETFKDQNKSAIIADLMREAVERAQPRGDKSHFGTAQTCARFDRRRIPRSP